MPVSLRTAFALVVLLTASAFAASPQSKPAPESCCSIVEQAIAAANAVEPGMTRAEVEKEFVEDGGAQFFGQPTRYVYRRCTQIKIDVDFAVPGPAKSPGVPNPQDRVKSVSRPYLEYMFMD